MLRNVCFATSAGVCKIFLILMRLDNLIRNVKKTEGTCATIEHDEYMDGKDRCIYLFYYLGKGR